LKASRWEVARFSAISFSLAALLLARVWQDVDEVTSPMAAYRLASGSPRTVEAVALLGMAVFTALFAALLFAAGPSRKSRSGAWPFRGLVALGALAVASIVWVAAEKASENLLASAWLQNHGAIWAGFLWASRAVRWVLIPAAIALGALCFPHRTWAAVQAVATVMIPFALWRTGHALYHLAAPRSFPIMANGPVHAQSQANPPWILWLVFDEMDQFAAFEDPANAPLLPSLHAFRRSAFYATRAYQPSDYTATAIPAYLTGRLAVEEQWAGRTGLQIRFAGRQSYSEWWQEYTILHEAAGLGHSVAILGHFHPYCRLFGALASACATFPACATADLKTWLATPEGSSLWQTARLELLRLLPLPPTRKRYDGKRFRSADWLLREHGIRSQSQCVAEVMVALRQWLRGSVATFYFLHLPIPHPPSIASCPELRCGHKIPFGYAGNLHWSDHLFDEVRGELVRQGRWATTTVIVTSDHSVRPDWESLPQLTTSMDRAIRLRKEPSVPLLIKLPGQQEGLAYHQPFNAVLLHGVIQGILQGSIRKPEDISRYLDQRRERVPLQPGQ
jgi:hypothetical protein